MSKNKEAFERQQVLLKTEEILKNLNSKSLVLIFNSEGNKTEAIMFSKYNDLETLGLLELQKQNFMKQKFSK